MVIDQVWDQYDRRNLALVKQFRGERGIAIVTLRKERDGFYSIVSAFQLDMDQRIDGKKIWQKLKKKK
jgi:hypothetical protein